MVLTTNLLLGLLLLYFYYAYIAPLWVMSQSSVLEPKSRHVYCYSSDKIPSDNLKTTEEAH